MDVKTPRNVYLSAFYKRSFAFHTVKNRMPVIITSLIDNLARSKEQIQKQYGEIGMHELKEVIGEISKFKYEIQTNKPLAPLRGNAPDVRYYNDYIEKQASEEGRTTHFNTIWLLTECYMYRRIKECFESTTLLKEYDYFQKQKHEAYVTAFPLILQMAYFVLDIILKDNCATKEVFISLVKLNLWGNKCDLSVSLGEARQHAKLLDWETLEPFVLADQSEDLWNTISETQSADDIIDIVLDNAGYEVFTDLCLADYIISTNLASKVRFYVKSIPWFVSDVMEHDFHSMIDLLEKNDQDVLKTLGKRWIQYVENGTWSVFVDDFWILPFEFKCMAIIRPDLYKKLAEAKVVIFKGDLNYRKLFGEINWDPATPVEVALQGFHPSKLCALRTIKADIVCGLEPGIAEETEKKDPKWMENGDFGLIQFCDKIVKID